MNYNYMVVHQKNSKFYMLKLDVGFLRESVSFHFRDPYKETYSNEEKMNVDSYLSYLRKKGITADDDQKGIQRRLNVPRINSIREFVEESDENFFSTSVVLSYNSSEEDSVAKELTEGSSDFGSIQFNKETTFTVIDGQHRLAGLLISDVSDDFEVPISLYVNIDLSSATKIFRDINGNQKPVSFSLMYDLYSNIDDSEQMLEGRLHRVCKLLNYPEQDMGFNSPFYKQIKMLGIGKGSISQAFFIQYYKMAITSIEGASDWDISKLYKEIFIYFKNIQKRFESDWPVPVDYEDLSDQELIDYANKVNKESKLLKTNGIGAWFLAFPKLYEYSKSENIPYNKILNRIDDFDWINIEGTGRSKQRAISVDLLQKMGIDTE